MTSSLGRVGVEQDRERDRITNAPPAAHGVGGDAAKRARDAPDSFAGIAGVSGGGLGCAVVGTETCGRGDTAMRTARSSLRYIQISGTLA